MSKYHINRAIRRAIPRIVNRIAQNPEGFNHLVEKEKQIMDLENQLAEMKYHHGNDVYNAIVTTMGKELI